MKLEQYLYSPHIRPLNMIYLRLFDHKQINSNDIPTMHWTEFKDQLVQIHVAGQRIFSHQLCIWKKLHKVSVLIGMELIMRPKRIIKSKIPMFFWIISIEKPGRWSHHVNAKPTVQVFLSLIIGSNSNSYFYTHNLESKYYIKFLTLLNNFPNFLLYLTS